LRQAPHLVGDHAEAGSGFARAASTAAFNAKMLV
jgi:hypothetical protein